MKSEVKIEIEKRAKKDIKKMLNCRGELFT